MVAGLSWLLAFQLAGELLVRLLALPLPGPVAGMALLFATLLWRGSPADPLARASAKLLQHLSLLFIPAGTGVVLYGALLAAEWLPLSIALLASTLLAMAVTAWALLWLLRRRDAPGRGR
jgi:holin-like protein